MLEYVIIEPKYQNYTLKEKEIEDKSQNTNKNKTENNTLTLKSSRFEFLRLIQNASRYTQLQEAEKLLAEKLENIKKLQHNSKDCLFHIFKIEDSVIKEINIYLFNLDNPEAPPSVKKYKLNESIPKKIEERNVKSESNSSANFILATFGIILVTAAVVGLFSLPVLLAISLVSIPVGAGLLIASIIIVVFGIALGYLANFDYQSDISTNLIDSHSSLSNHKTNDSRIHQSLSAKHSPDNQNNKTNTEGDEVQNSKSYNSQSTLNNQHTLFISPKPLETTKNPAGTNDTHHSTNAPKSS